MSSSLMARNKEKDHEPNPRPCLPPCRVCGDQAAGYHYGVNTCEACKGFFHRSLRRYKEYTCRANRSSGYCEYKPGKRKSCQFCRYQRCLMAGMSRQAIKTGRYTYTKRMNDTREIKRLQSLQHHLLWDIPDPDSPASFKSTASADYNIAESPGHELDDQSFVEVDVATREEFERLLSSGHSHNSRVFLSDSSPLWSSKSVQYERHNKPFSSILNNSLYCSSEATRRHFLPFSVENVEESSIEQEIDSPTPLSKSGTYFVEANSDFIRYKSDVHYTLDNKLSTQNQNCQITYDSFINCDAKHGRDSVIYRPERIGNIRDISAGIWEQKRKNLNHNDSKRQACITMETPEMEQDMSESTSSSFNHTCTTYVTDSAGIEATYLEQHTRECDHEQMAGSAGIEATYLEQHTRECDHEQMAGSDFDLFPDISLNLNEQQRLSPVSFANNDIEAQIVNPLGQCSSLSNASPINTIQSSELNQGTFNLDRGGQQQCNNDGELFQESGLIRSWSHCIPGSKDTGVPQDTDLYKGCSDLSVDSRSCTQSSTSGQTNLPALDSPGLDSISSSSNHLLDKNSLHTMPTSDPNLGVKDVQHVNIPELYRDKDAVIATLIASYKVSVGDYSRMPKEEMVAQQKAHYEACQLKKQTFGDLGFLPEHEYDEIYSVTGIDVDNRRTVIRKFLNKMEKDVRDLVQFAKSIPGFSYLDINLQKELVKLARAECAMISHYRTVNLELGVMVGLTGEHWACYSELGTDDVQSIIAEYVLFSDKLQKMAPTQEEEVLLKAIIVVSTDADTSVNSKLAEAIRWQLVMCLLHSLVRNRQEPSLYLARYILTLTQSRTVAESLKDFLRKMKLRKYSSIEQNQLLWEICSWIVLEKRDEDSIQQQNTGSGLLNRI